jgi:hypothetical protein
MVSVSCKGNATKIFSQKTGVGLIALTVKDSPAHPYRL